MNRLDSVSNEIRAPIQDMNSGHASSATQNDQTLGQDDEDYNPDTAIKAAFKDAFKTGDLEYDGDFTYSRLFHDAPNPCLKLEGPGAIGLPLNNIQIDVIKRFCVEDEVGASGTGGNTWIYPSEKVMTTLLFLYVNPAWSSWLSEIVVPQLTGALGASANPILIPDGLKIRGPQTNTTPTPIVVKQRARDAGQYATVLIILPSPHIGGNINVKCGGVTKVFRTAKHSKISTTVIGTLSGADLILDQVDSGNVVSLEYILACPPDTSPPRVPQLQHAKDCLQRAFYLWRQAVDAESIQSPDPSAPKSPPAPNFYIYTLTDTYSALDLQKTSLRGCDQKSISLMEPLARCIIKSNS
ncbi:hypothetical protein AAF712_011279 [Marasmius tenuissimus]|uniref:Uncharacterized protein n=1 Tax=Marasmius tenuissimus TaxID=585030 RepID=A0ABR2ZKN9_9AGAR